MQIPVVSTAPQDLTLRISVTGPNANLTGVFDLGDKHFVIGRAACHLRLPKAPIPDHAIEIFAAEGGFMVSGLDGFPLTLGAVSAPSVLLLPNQSVKLVIIPYSLELQTSNTPGSPVKDLSEIQAKTPVQNAPQALPQPAPSGRPGGSAPGMPRGQQQVQSLAEDVRPAPGAFGGGPTSLLDEVDGDMTITDLGAMGIHAQSHNVDPLQGLDLSLIRADGPQQGQKFQITKTPLLIGRSEHGMQIIDKRVSSKHAQLDVSGPWVYTLKDLASTNGTAVNGRPISVAHLGDGDEVSFGGVLFTFKAHKGS